MRVAVELFAGRSVSGWDTCFGAFSLEKRVGRKRKGGNLRPERRGGTMLSHRDLLWGSRQTVERDVPLARLTIATDVEARVSWEWLWDDALVNGL